MTAFADTIPSFLRRPLEQSPPGHGIEFRDRDPVAPAPLRPCQVIHAGLPPLQPNFLTLGAAETFDPIHAPGIPAGDTPATAPAANDYPGLKPPTSDGGVVDLTARRGVVSSAKSASRMMSRALHAAFEAEPGVTGGDDDAAFQVTLPRSVIRQIRLFAAEQGTTHRAVVLRALRAAGLNIPEGADVDRRAMAAKRRHQA